MASDWKDLKDHLEAGFFELVKIHNFTPEGKNNVVLLDCLATSDFINMPKLPVNSVKKPSQTSHFQANKSKYFFK